MNPMNDLPWGEFVACGIIGILCIWYIITHWNNVFPK